MGDLSENFNRGEFACRCGCGGATVYPELITVLEALRAHFGKPVQVFSGYRCRDHNRRVGGAAKSMHLLGLAADVSVRDVAPKRVHDWLAAQYPGRYGIGGYLTFTHIDVRGTAARWGVWLKKG